ncbi:hypothetical protein L345_18064, partial [Ophiophagus hannah]
MVTQQWLILPRLSFALIKNWLLQPSESRKAEGRLKKDHLALASQSNTMKTQNILALNLILLAGVVCHPAAQKEKTAGVHKLLLISFDGFRWNYDEDVDTPHLDYLAKEGVKAKYITPPFVTMTSPSHFTIITGKAVLYFFFQPYLFSGEHSPEVDEKEDLN